MIQIYHLKLDHWLLFIPTNDQLRISVNPIPYFGLISLVTLYVDRVIPLFISNMFSLEDVQTKKEA